MQQIVRLSLVVIIVRAAETDDIHWHVTAAAASTRKINKHPFATRSEATSRSATTHNLSPFLLLLVPIKV